MNPNDIFFVIIPAYRPDEKLIGLTTEVCDCGFRLLVVDDGSGADYLPIFDRVDSRATVLRHEVNRGKGAAIKTGLAHLQATLTPDEANAVVGIMDADGQHLPSDMAKVLAEAAAQPGELALGVRVIDGKMPLRSRLGNAITRTLFHLISGTRVSDTQTGLRAISAYMIPTLLEIDGNRYEYEMNMLSAFSRKGYGICEVPIATIYQDRKNSTSHFHVIRDSFLIYRSLFKFAGSSFISFLVDYGFFCLFSSLLAPALGTYGDLGANIMARLISATLNYNLNCRMVFKTKPSVRSAVKYALLCACILAVNSGVLYLWKMTPVPVPVCKLLTEICMFFVNYLMQKKVIFKDE